MSNATAIETETDNVETETVATEAIETAAEFIGETIGGCAVEFGATFRNVRKADVLLGQVFEFGDEWHALPIEGMATSYESLELAVAHLISAQIASAAAAAVSRGKGKDPKARAISLVTIHTRRYYRYSRELNMAENAYTRAVAAFDKAEAACTDKRAKLATSKTGFTAQDAMDISERKRDLASLLVDAYDENRKAAGVQLDTVSAQRDQAEREARENYGATQADVDKARAAGKPKKTTA